MAIEDIIRQIEQDARAEADSLLMNAKAEAEANVEKSRRQAEELRAEETKKDEEQAREHGRRIETLAGLELRKETLKEKKDLIAQAFDMAEDRIANLPPEEYRAFLRPIILGAIESGREEIVPSEEHRSVFTDAFIQSLNDEMGPENGHLCLSDESGDFSGGFVLRDGRKEMNMTLGSLIASGRDRLEPEVATVLFGEKR